MSNFISLPGQDGLVRAFRTKDISRIDDVTVEGEGLAVVVSMYDGTQLTLKSTVSAVLKLINLAEK